MIAGITGHQNPGDVSGVEWIRDVLADLVVQRSVDRGLSSLAVGVDQIFVEVLQSAQIEFEAVIPCTGYEATFSGGAARARYEGFVACAANVHRLPFHTPTEEAFLAAGQWIVSRCDLLIAVWNALPARGLGGTADVVAVAQARRRPWIHVNPIERTINVHASLP